MRRIPLKWSELSAGFVEWVTTKILKFDNRSKEKSC